MLWIGLMSGTSADGVDAALVGLGESPRELELVHFCSSPFSDSLRERIHGVLAGPVALRELLALDRELGKRFPGREYSGRIAWFLAQSFSGKGEHERAIAIIDSLEAEEAGWKRISANIYARGGRVEEALQILEERARAGESEPSIASGYFEVYAVSGRYEEALMWAEKGYELSPVLVQFFNVADLPADLRADPRFQDLMRRVGLGQNRGG